MKITVVKHISLLYAGEKQNILIQRNGKAK